MEGNINENNFSIMIETIMENIIWMKKKFFFALFAFAYSLQAEEGALKIPYELWKNPESKTTDLQMTNNQKCPILLLASHFYIPMSTNILDVNHVYLMKFKVIICILPRNPLR